MKFRKYNKVIWDGWNFWKAVDYLYNHSNYNVKKHDVWKVNYTVLIITNDLKL